MTIKDIYEKVGAREFGIAVSFAMNIGLLQIRNMTDYEIYQFHENGNLTWDRLKLARLIAQTVDEVYILIQFLTHVKLCGEGEFKEKKPDPNYYITFKIKGKYIAEVYANNIEDAIDKAEDSLYLSDIGSGFQLTQMDLESVEDDKYNILRSGKIS